MTVTGVRCISAVLLYSHSGTKPPSCHVLMVCLHASLFSFFKFLFFVLLSAALGLPRFVQAFLWLWQAGAALQLCCKLLMAAASLAVEQTGSRLMGLAAPPHVVSSWTKFLFPLHLQAHS